jgi:hypothetical protein
MEAILRQSKKPIIDHFQVHAMSGDGTAVLMNKYHNDNPSVSIPSVCVIDGDSRQTECDDTRVLRLPGDAPESYIFDSIIEDWPNIGGKISVALLQKYEESDKVLQLCQDVRRTNKDTHLLYSQLGEKLGLVPEKTVSLAFATLWAQNHSDIVDDLLAKMETDNQTEQ